MEMPVEKIETWIEVLRSGLYKQTKKALQDNNGFCCLGVACDIFMPENEIDRHFDELMVGSLPTSQQNAPDWLKSINLEFGKKTSYQLSDLNDGCVQMGEFSFDEIADLLQAVYIEKVLD